MKMIAFRLSNMDKSMVMMFLELPCHQFTDAL